MSNGVKDYFEKWSWGGFALTFIYILALKKYKMLWWLLLALVPFANIIFVIVWKIHWGLKGRQYLKESVAFADDKERMAFESNFSRASFIAFMVWVACVVLYVVIVLVTIGVASMGAVREFNELSPDTLEQLQQLEELSDFDPTSIDAQLQFDGGQASFEFDRFNEDQ